MFICCMFKSSSLVILTHLLCIVLFHRGLNPFMVCQLVMMIIWWCDWLCHSAPAKGEYGLEIYANDPELDGNSLYHAYQYLIICMESVANVEPLPMLPPGFLGAQASFRKLGLSCATHEDPYIHCDSGDIAVWTLWFCAVRSNKNESSARAEMAAQCCTSQILTFERMCGASLMHSFSVISENIIINRILL